MSVKFYARRSRVSLVLVAALLALLSGFTINQVSLLGQDHNIAIRHNLNGINTLSEGTIVTTLEKRDIIVEHGAIIDTPNTTLYTPDGLPHTPLSQTLQTLYGILPEAQAHQLHKRFNVEDYNKLVQRGQDLSCLMSADINTADQMMGSSSQSTFTAYDMLNEYGYTVEKHPPGFYNIEKHAAVGARVGFSVDAAQNEDITIEHNNPWVGGDGQTNRPSGGEFVNVYNTQDGIIFAMDLQSPSAIARMSPFITKPALAYFSDITFLEWAQLQGVTNSAPPAQVKPPRYMLIDTAVNTLTVNTISYIRNQRHVDSFGPWPGQKFTPNDPEFFALLASPNCYGTAWFLIQHKSQFGRTAVTEITLWGVGYFNFILMKIEPVQSSGAEAGGTGAGAGAGTGTGDRRLKAKL